jgi:PAS domain S-box-containing protein
LEFFKSILIVLKEWLSLLAPFGIVGAALWKFWLKQRYEEGRELYGKIQKMAEEFRPNGGSTLRDAINRIEDKITLQEQKTIAIIKSLPLGTWISDERGKCIDVNRSLCKIIGRTEGEIKGDNWSNWIHPDEKDDVFEEWYRCVQNDLNFDMEYRFVLPSGKFQKVHGVAYQLRDVNNKLIGFLGTLSVIKEQSS